MWKSLGYVAMILACAQSANSEGQGHGAAPRLAISTSQFDGVDASPIYGVTVPKGYRRWELVGVSYEKGLDEFRAILANPIAIKAYRDGVLPFSEGAVLAKLAWKRIPSSEAAEAFVPGDATTTQFMVKDSKRYASSGGWGFGRFVAGIPTDEAQHESCFACHQSLVKNHDFVFTRLAH
jgi:hypothetical protein